MKKASFFTYALLLFSLVSYGQDYLIDFNASGAATTIESITIKNVFQNTTLTIDGSNVLHLSASADISENSIFDSFNIYPNPTSNEFNIDVFSEIKGNSNITVFDLSGRVVFTQNVITSYGMNNYTINYLPKGYYIISFNNEFYSISQKIISHSVFTDNNNIVVSNNGVIFNNIDQIKNCKAIVDMQYNEGDLLIFEINSGNLSTITSLTPTQSQTLTVTFVGCTDNDGNSYPVVNLGSQTWMAANLSVTTPTGSWCYNEIENNCITYGKLYNWETAMNSASSTEAIPSGVQGVCPTGWHLPSRGEWDQLRVYLISAGYNYDGGTSGNKIAKSLASNSGWISTSTNGAVGNNLELNNATGFSVLPAGVRGADGIYSSIGIGGFFWSTTVETLQPDDASVSSLYYSGVDLREFDSNKNYGISIRCLKD